jgi:hypothetical protein
MLRETDGTAANATDRRFAFWCVMDHARPVVIDALRAWHMETLADPIAKAPSLASLRLAATDADIAVRGRIGFDPLRRDLSHAINTLHAAATFAARGDAENTAAVVVGVFTHAASAVLWRRPWTRFGWKRRRATLIATVRHEQQTYREQIRVMADSHTVGPDSG